MKKIDDEIEKTTLLITNLNITKLFYKHNPTIKVNMKNGKPIGAKLKISGVSYWFHNTNKDGKEIRIRKEGDSYIIPFDGWSL